MYLDPLVTSRLIREKMQETLEGYAAKSPMPDEYWYQPAEQKPKWSLLSFWYRPKAQTEAVGEGKA